MNGEHMFADGVESLCFLEGMFRLELFCYGERGEDGKAARVPAGRLVLPPVGFLKAYETMGELVRRLREQGLVTHQPQPQPEPKAGADEGGKTQPEAFNSPSVPRVPSASNSPNFQ